METEQNSPWITFCPYYINIDRLIDISASLSNGYSEYEDIEISKTTSQDKSKAFSGKHPNKFFSLGFESSSSSIIDSAESKKVKRIHTPVSLLNSTTDTLKRAKKLNDLSSRIIENSKERRPLLECGDVVTFAGTIKQDQHGFVDLSPCEKSDKTVANIKMTMLIFPIIVIVGIIILLLTEYINVFIMRIGLFGAIIVECFLFTYLLLLSCITSDQARTYKAFRKLERKNISARKIRIDIDKYAFLNKIFESDEEARKLYKMLDTVFFLDKRYEFLCYLYDDYFYQGDLKDILGRTIDCLAIVKSISKSYVEIEVIAIYISLNSTHFPNGVN